MDNSGGKVALSVQATTANTAKQRKKERATISEVKCEPGEGGSATEQKQGGEGAAELCPRESNTAASLIFRYYPTKL